jgi:hypothetical protein
VSIRNWAIQRWRLPYRRPILSFLLCPISVSAISSFSSATRHAGRLPRACSRDCQCIFVTAKRDTLGRVGLEKARSYGHSNNFFKIGGEGGIRTHGTLARTLDFESSTFGHSVTSPGWVVPGLASRAAVCDTVRGTRHGTIAGFVNQYPVTIERRRHCTSSRSRRPKISPAQPLKR